MASKSLQLSTPHEKIETPTPLFVLRTHRCEVSSLELSHLPLSLFFLSSEHYFNYLQNHDTKPPSSDSSASAPTTARLDKSIQVLISGDSTGRVVIWDLELRQILLDFKPHTDVVLNVQLICSGLILLTQGKEGCIKVWSIPRLIHMLYEQVMVEPTSHQFLQQSLLQANISSLIHTNDSKSTHPSSNDPSVDDIVKNHQQQFAPQAHQQPSKPVVIVNTIADLLYLDDEEEEEVDLGDYGFLLADSGAVQLDPTSPPPSQFQSPYSLHTDPSQQQQQQSQSRQNQDHQASTEQAATTEQLLTQCFFKMTLLDLFRHHFSTSVKIMFSFDASIPARLSVLITNSYTFSKMKSIFVEHQLTLGDPFVTSALSNSSANSSTASNRSNADIFQPHGVRDLQEDNDDEQVRAFLSKYQRTGKSLHLNDPSTAQSTTPSDLTTPAPEPIKINGFNIPPTSTEPPPSTSTSPSPLPLKIQSAILDLGYLFLAPCENSSSLKIWRINFSFNLHSPHSNPSFPTATTTTSNSLQSSQLPSTTTTAHNYARLVDTSFCDDMSFEPFHVQTLVIDKHDGEDSVAHDSALAELRRLNQFRPQNTIDELELQHSQNERQLNDGILPENIDDVGEQQQLLTKSGLVMHVDVVCLDSNKSLIHVLTNAHSDTHPSSDTLSTQQHQQTQKASTPPPPRSLEQFQATQMVQLLAYFAHNNKQVVITALSNLYHQLLLTQQQQHNWLQVHLSNEVELDDESDDDANDDANNDTQIGPKLNTSLKGKGKDSTQNAAKPKPEPLPPADTSDLLRNIANDPAEMDHLHPPIDKIMEHRVTLQSTSSGLAKMLKTRQLAEKDDYEQRRAANSSNDAAMTIKQSDIEIYKLFQILLTYLLQTRQLQPFLSLLFNLNQQQSSPSSTSSNQPITHNPNQPQHNTDQDHNQSLFLLSLVTEGGHLLLYQLNLHKMFVTSSPATALSPAPSTIAPSTPASASTSTSSQLGSILDSFFTALSSFAATNNLAPEQYALKLSRDHALNHNTIVSTFKLLFLYLSTSIYSTKHEYSMWLQMMYHTLKHPGQSASTTDSKALPNPYNTSPFANVSYASLPQHEQNFYRICANFERLSPTQQKNVLATLPPSMILLLNRVKPQIASDSIVYDQRTILLSPDHPSRQSSKIKKSPSLLNSTSSSTSPNDSTDAQEDMYSTLQISSVASHFMLPALFLIRLLALADGSFSTQASNQSIRAATSIIEEIDPDEESAPPNSSTQHSTSSKRSKLDDIDYSAPFQPQPVARRTKLCADVVEFDDQFYLPSFTSPTGLLLHRLQLCYFYMCPPRFTQRAALMKPTTTSSTASSSSSAAHAHEDHKQLLKDQFPQLLQYRTLATSSSSRSSGRRSNIATASASFLHLAQHLSSVHLLYHQRIIKDTLLASTLGNPLVLTPDVAAHSPHQLASSQSSSQSRLLSPPILSFRVILVGNERYVKTLTFHANIVPSLTISKPLDLPPPQPRMTPRPNPFARPPTSNSPHPYSPQLISDAHLIIKPTLTNLEIVAQASSSPHLPSQFDTITNQPIQQLLSQLFAQSHELSIRLIHVQRDLHQYQHLLSQQRSLQSTLHSKRQLRTDGQEDRTLDDEIAETQAQLDNLKQTTFRFFTSFINSNNFSTLLFLLTHFSATHAPSNDLNSEEERSERVATAGRLQNRRILLKTGYKVSSLLCVSLMVMQILSTSKLALRTPQQHSKLNSTPSHPSSPLDDDAVNAQLREESNLSSEQLIWSFMDQNSQPLAPDSHDQANPIQAATNNTQVIKAGYSVLSFSALEPLCSTIVVNSPPSRDQQTTTSPSTLSCIFYGSKHIITCGWDHRVRLLSSDIDFDLSLLFARSWHLSLNHFISSLFAHYSSSIAPQHLPTDDSAAQFQSPTLSQYAQQQALILNWLGSAVAPTSKSTPSTNPAQLSNFLTLNQPSEDSHDSPNLQTLLDEPLFDDLPLDHDTPLSSSQSSDLGSASANNILANITVANIETSITAVLDEIQTIFTPSPSPQTSSTPPIDIHREYTGVIQALKAHYKRIGLYIKYLEPFDVVFLWTKLGQVKKHIVGSAATNLSLSPDNDQTITRDVLEYYRSQLLFFVSQCYTNHLNAIRASIVIAFQQYTDYIKANPHALKGDGAGGDGLGMGSSSGSEDPNSMLQQFMAQQSGSQFKDVLSNPNGDLLSKLTQQDPAALEKLSQRLQSGESIENIAKDLAQLGGLAAQGGSGGKKQNELTQLKEMMNPKQYNMTGVTVNILSPGDHLLHYMLCLRHHTQSVMEDLVEQKTMALEAQARAGNLNGDADGAQDKSEEDIIRDKLKNMARGGKEKKIDAIGGPQLTPQQMQQYEDQLVLGESTNNVEHDGALIHNNKLVLMYIFDTISAHILPIRPAAVTGPGGMNLSQLSSSLSPGQQNQLQGAMQQQQQQQQSQLRFDVESVTKHIKLSYLVPYQQHCVGFLKLQQGIFTIQQEQHMQFLDQQQHDSSSSQLIKYPRNTAIQRLILMNKFGLFISLANSDADSTAPTPAASATKKSTPLNHPFTPSSLSIPNIAISATILPALLPQILNNHITPSPSPSTPSRQADPDSLLQLVFSSAQHHPSDISTSVSTFLIEQALFELITFFLSSYDITNILSQSQEQRWLDISRFDKMISSYKHAHALELDEMSATLQSPTSAPPPKPVASSSSHQDTAEVYQLHRSLTFATTPTPSTKWADRSTADYVEISSHQFFNRDIRPNVTVIHEYQYKTMVMTMYGFINKIQTHQQDQVKEAKKREIRRKVLLSKAKQKGVAVDNVFDEDDLDKIDIPLSLSEMRDLISVLQKLGCFCCYYSDIALLTQSLLKLSYKLQDAVSSTSTTSTNTTAKLNPRALPPKSASQTSTKPQQATQPASKSPPQSTSSTSFKQRYYINRKKLIINALQRQQQEDHQYHVSQQHAQAEMAKERLKHEKKLEKERKRAMKHLNEGKQTNLLRTKTGMVIELLSSSSSDSDDDDGDVRDPEHAGHLDAFQTDPEQPHDLNLPQLSLDNEQEYNTDLDIVALFGFKPNADMAAPLETNGAGGSGADGDSAAGDLPFNAILNMNGSESNLTQSNPTFALSLLIHSVQRPLHQDLLLKFHDGQISSFSLAPPSTQDTMTPLARFAPSDFYRAPQSDPSKSLVEHRNGQLTEFPSDSNPNRSQLVTLTHNQIRQLAGAVMNNQSERPAMATAGTDGVIAVWKTFL